MSKIVKREQDFAKWYTSIVLEADLVDYGLAKGTMIFKPYGWQIWNLIKQEFTKKLEEVGTEECCLPLMIPYSEFIKEKKHIEGFNPELYKVSFIGDKKLEDELVIRPTSEIAFCHYFQKNVSSYNTLPMILNQWCNVFRVEKNTRPFLRTCEFFWQEQHAVFALEKEAQEFSLKMLNVYENFVKDYLSIALLSGEKTENERFAGANNTYTIEAIMPDGQALQSGTSHYLGTNFSKNFDIKFQDKDNSYKYVYQTSAGISTRIMGAIIMSHSDNEGLVLPFKIAPIQFAIVASNQIEKDVINNIAQELKEYRTKVQIVEKSIGLTLQKNEIMGIPFQVIIGKKELETNTVTIYNRAYKTKVQININEFENKVVELIKQYENELYNRSLNNMKNSIVEIDNLEDFKKQINNKKVVLCYWNGTVEDEKKIKELTGATARCFPLNSKPEANKKCFYTNKENARLIYFARAY